MEFGGSRAFAAEEKRQGAGGRRSNPRDARSCADLCKLRLRQANAKMHALLGRLLPMARDRDERMQLAAAQLIATLTNTRGLSATW